MARTLHLPYQEDEKCYGVFMALQVSTRSIMRRIAQVARRNQSTARRGQLHEWCVSFAGHCVTPLPRMAGMSI